MASAGGTVVIITHAAIANYRVHQELSVEFAAGVTVLLAGNESGKSTLGEAMHAALFLKHRSGGKTLDRMKSVLGGYPTVTLRFTADGAAWQLTKIFRGGSGSCELVNNDTALQWQGDDAEAQLAELTVRLQTVRGGLPGA